MVAPAHSRLSSSRGWVIAEGSLLVIWVVAGVMTMYPAIARASGLERSLFTSYGADLTQPAWLYIVTRRSCGMLGRLFGRTPELAASSVVGGATLTEITQLYWPQGVFRGTFDPLDIVAYATGVFLCWIADRRFVGRAPRPPYRPNCGVPTIGYDTVEPRGTRGTEEPEEPRE